MRYSSSYIAKLVFIVVGTVIGVLSLLYSNYIATELAIKEKREINLWSHAIALTVLGDPRSQTIIDITTRSTSIPAIIVDEYMRIVDFQEIDTSEVNTPMKLRQRLESMAMGGRTPVPIELPNGKIYTIFYDESTLLKGLFWYPFLQIIIIAIFVVFAMITFRSSKQSEQNKVWVGMSKETAHQLGTPTSSLLGWIEYLRTQPIAPDVVDEMNKDVTRLMKVVDRFSKIGSTTLLKPENVFDVTNSVVDYFRTRIPKGVTLKIDGFSDIPLQAAINAALFEWVIENLLKNALDALAGKGSIDVHVTSNAKKIVIDVVDSGKGIAKKNWRSIFKPGYTTKTRGWGLGLSLSKRIVEQYHNGKIFVHNSETDKGTTMRVELRKL